jgi:type IV pilus biogenesis protein PilP
MSAKNQTLPRGKTKFAAAAVALVIGLALPQITHAQVTIQTLSDLQRAELDRQIADKQKSLIESAKPPAPPASEVALLAKKLPDVLLTLTPPVPPPTKKVLAIYGKPGAEKVEISLPDGAIVTATSGQPQPGSWQLLSVSANTVVVEITKPANTAKGNKKNAQNAQSSPVKTTRTLRVGETF